MRSGNLLNVRDWSVLLLAVVVVLSGCSGSSTVVQTPVAIPVKVYRVFASNDTRDDSDPNYRANIGCRTTSAEIAQYITNLNTNLKAVLSDPGISIQWDQNIGVVDAPLESRTYDSEILRASVYASWITSGDTTVFFPTAVNIYFTGNLIDPATSTTIADCRDPYDVGYYVAGATFEKVPSIIVNDGCGTVAFPRNLFTPTDLMSYYVLEHEMIHYLGRFTGCTYQTPDILDGRVWTGSEHIIPATGGGIPRDNLMRYTLFDPPLGFPLRLTGYQGDENSESAQVRTRVRANGWNVAGSGWCQ